MSGYGLVMAMRVKDKCDSSNELLTLLAIANFVDENGRGCYASRQTLADQVLISEETVKRCIPRLAAKGLITPGNPAVVAHIPSNRRPKVWDLATVRERGRAMTPQATGQDAEIQSSGTLGGLTDPSNGSLGGQTIFPRGVCQTPNPVLREPATLLPAVASNAADAQGAAGQAGGEHTHNPNLPADTAPVESAAVPPSVEAEEKSGADGTETGDSASASGLREAAAQVLSAIGFERTLQRGERERLTARLSALLAGGHTVDSLVKIRDDMGGARSRIGLFTSKVNELPETAPVVPEPKRAPTAAEALAASEAAAAADRDAELSDADRDAARVLLDQIRAKRAQSAPESAGGVIAPGAATKRREAAQSVAAGPARIGVLTRDTSKRCQCRR